MDDRILLDALIDGYCEYLSVFKGEDKEEALEGVGRSFEGLDTIEDGMSRLYFPFRIDEYQFGMVKFCLNKLGYSEEIIFTLADVFAKEYIRYIVETEERHHEMIFRQVPRNITIKLHEALKQLNSIDVDVYLDENCEKYVDDVDEIKDLIVKLNNRIKEDLK